MILKNLHIIEKNEESIEELFLMAIAASCYITKYAGLKGFEKKNISYTAIDMD